MILIDNLKKVRKLNYIFNINSNFKKYKYIIICDLNTIQNSKIKIETLLNNNNNDTNFLFLKNIKCINFILKNHIKNSILLFFTNDFNNLIFLLSNLKNSVLFVKLDNNYYSINFKNNYSSVFELLTYFNNYFNYFFSILNTNLEKKKCI